MGLINIERVLRTKCEHIPVDRLNTSQEWEGEGQKKREKKRENLVINTSSWRRA